LGDKSLLVFRIACKTISDGMGCKSSIKATEYQTFVLLEDIF
jgi:hypothetical protein